MRNIGKLLAVLAAISLAACGSGNKSSSSTKSTTTTTTTQSSPAAVPASPASGTSSMTEPNPNATVAAVPASLNCAGDTVVWATPKRHVYHLSNDPYYGRTHSGRYMCMQQARSQGYHAAGARSGGKHHAMKGALPEASPT